MKESDSPKLFTVEFLSLCFVSFFAFCNLSVFYSFLSYLKRLQIPIAYQGTLLGLEPLTAFLLRPLISVRLHVGNSLKILFLSLLMIFFCLLSYLWAQTVWSLVAVRIFHGAAFVLLVSSSMALVVHFIPKKRSAQGFGIVSITTLVPYAVMPLITEALLPLVKNEAHIYASVSVFTWPALILILKMRKRITQVVLALDSVGARAFSLVEIKENFKKREIIWLLFTCFLLYLVYASVFFFVKQLALHLKVGSVGYFFTISTVMIIATRFFAGKKLDSLDKIKALQVLVILLALALWALSHNRASWCFFLLAMAYGFCMGMIFPLLNSALFAVSPPQYRGLNTNFSLFMMDAGFFISPMLGGALLDNKISIISLFTGAAIISLLPILTLQRTKPRSAW